MLAYLLLLLFNELSSVKISCGTVRLQVDCLVTAVTLHKCRKSEFVNAVKMFLNANKYEWEHFVG